MKAHQLAAKILDCMAERYYEEAEILAVTRDGEAFEVDFVLWDEHRQAYVITIAPA